jgi:hypothetical protein
LIETVNGKTILLCQLGFTKTTGLLTFEDKMAMGKFNITTTTPRTQHFSRPKAKQRQRIDH